MMTIAEIRAKADALEQRAAESDDARAVALRAMALQWRLLEVEATFMEAWRQDWSEPP